MIRSLDDIFLTDSIFIGTSSTSQSLVRSWFNEPSDVWETRVEKAATQLGADTDTDPVSTRPKIPSCHKCYF